MDAVIQHHRGVNGIAHAHIGDLGKNMACPVKIGQGYIQDARTDPSKSFIDGKTKLEPLLRPIAVEDFLENFRVRPAFDLTRLNPGQESKSRLAMRVS